MWAQFEFLIYLYTMEAILAFCCEKGLNCEHLRKTKYCIDGRIYNIKGAKYSNLLTFDHKFIVEIIEKLRKTHIKNKIYGININDKYFTLMCCFYDNNVVVNFSIRSDHYNSENVIKVAIQEFNWKTDIYDTIKLHVKYTSINNNSFKVSWYGTITICHYNRLQLKFSKSRNIYYDDFNKLLDGLPKGYKNDISTDIKIALKD